MSPLVVVILALVILAPIGWFASEYQERRWLRQLLGSAAILLSFGVAAVVGSLERLNSNAWFGQATSRLLDATVAELEAGRSDRVVRSLKGLRAKYHPTYENRAAYDQLVEEALEQMKGP